MTTRISPSQIQTWRLCPRKWGFKKLDKIPDPGSAAAELGSTVHTHLENWLLHGLAPPADKAGKLATALIPTLPAPGSVEVEHRFLLPITSDLDLALHGLIDVRGVWGDPEVPRVRDHKTTSGLKWAKTPDDLLTDPQSVIYAAAAIEHFHKLGHWPNGEIPEVINEWGYVVTRGARKVHVVRQAMRGDSIAAQLEDIVKEAEQMALAHREGLTGNDLPYNTEGCSAFGGCPFRNQHCNITSRERFRSIMSKMTLQERIAAKKAQQGGDTPAPAAAPAAAPTAAAAPAAAPAASTAGMTLQERIAAKKATQGGANPGVNPPAATPAAAQAPAAAETTTTPAAATKAAKPAKKRASPKAAAGLGVRDAAAVGAMRSIMANPTLMIAIVDGNNLNHEAIAEQAVAMADALVAKLGG